MKKYLMEYGLIALGSLFYALSTNLFIFPHGLLLGGTSGISVILEAFLPFSPGTILMGINFALLILAFLLLGRDMAIKTLVGSTLTTLMIGLLESPLTLEAPLVSNLYLSAVIGAGIIAIASGIMFYVDSSSGGTDIIALIVKKYKDIQIGRALLLTDIAIVILGGLLSGFPLFLGSILGLLVKTFGIDFVIAAIRKWQAKKGN